MDKLAEELAKWFGSTAFISFHVIWFAVWIILHFSLDFDQEWSTLTFVVSLEAIFLSLFILRAENVQAERFEREVKRNITVSKQIQDKLDRRKKNT